MRLRSASKTGFAADRFAALHRQDPCTALAYKGYDRGATAKGRALLAYAPRAPSANVKNLPQFFPKSYAPARGLARIEISVGKIKRFKRIALRREETAANFASVLMFVLAIISAKSQGLGQRQSQAGL